MVSLDCTKVLNISAGMDCKREPTIPPTQRQLPHGAVTLMSVIAIVGEANTVCMSYERRAHLRYILDFHGGCVESDLA
jgi:hypothetical protein